MFRSHHPPGAVDGGRGRSRRKGCITVNNVMAKGCSAVRRLQFGSSPVQVSREFRINLLTRGPIPLPPSNAREQEEEKETEEHRIL